MTERSGRLIKWDGDPPSEPEAYVNPEQHPKCLEVIEFDAVASNVERPPVVVYKREDG